MIASAQLGHQQVRQHPGEPGARAEDQPRRRQRTAATACGQASGASGRSHTRRTRPGVDATATCPRIRRTPGSARPQPGDLGLDVQRLAAPSAAPGPAARAARRPRPAPPPGRPSISDQPGQQQVARPRARPARRCRRSGAAQRPPRAGPGTSSRGQRVHRHPQVPGGSWPSSRRSRPDEPPSSATVTTAVRCCTSSPRSASRRRADSVACSPWPPPSATALNRPVAGSRSPAPPLTRDPCRGA